MYTVLRSRDDWTRWDAQTKREAESLGLLSILQGQAALLSKPVEPAIRDYLPRRQPMRLPENLHLELWPSLIKGAKSEEWDLDLEWYNVCQEKFWNERDRLLEMMSYFYRTVTPVYVELYLTAKLEIDVWYQRLRDVVGGTNANLITAS